MAQVVALEASFDTSQAEGSVKSLKSQLKEAQADVQKIADKFGATSDQAVKAAKKAAELKDKIGDAKALTDAFNPDAKFKAFGAALQGVAGGFAALQGAQALFGGESKELEKTLLKVQGAMALSQGLNALGEAGDSFKTLGKQGVEAFNKIKVAIGSTGIGLLIIALGTIYAYWDDIKEAVSGVSAEQKKLNAASDKNLKTQKEKLSAISSQDNILKLQGKSEKDILKIKIAQTDATIAAAETSLQNNINTLKAQIKSEAKNKEILKGMLDFLSIPLSLLLGTIDKIGAMFGKNFGLMEGFKEKVSSMVFDPKKVEEEGNKAIEEQKKALTELKNQQAGYKLQVQDIDKKSGEEKKAKDKKSGDDAIAKQKEINDILKSNEEKRLQNQLASEKLTQEARLALITDEYQKKQQIIAENEQKAIDDELDRLSKGQITKEQYEINRTAIETLYGQQRADAAKANGEKIIAEEKKKADEDVKIAKEKADQKKAIQDAEFAALDGGLAVLKVLAGKNKSLQKAAIIAEGAIGVAKIITNTQTAIASYRAGMALIPPLLPPGIPNPAFAAAKALGNAQILGAKLSAAGSIATTISATAKALSSLGGGGAPSGGNNGGGGSEGGGGGVTAPIQPQASATTLNQMAINNAGNQAIKTYVVESDVSGNQERIDRIQRAARIGP